MIIKIGNHDLFVKKRPAVFFDDIKGIMTIIIIVEDKNGDMYELHYFSSLDDPDLITKNIKNTIDLEG